MASILFNTLPIHLIGESHCIAYNNIIFESWRTELAFICRSRYLNIPAQQCTLEEGNIHPSIFASLKENNLINDDGFSTHLSSDTLKVSVDYLSGRPVMAAPIVLFAGGMDMVFLTKHIGTQFDFELPNNTLLGIEENKELVPFAQIQQEVEYFFAPFFLLVKKLRENGFNRLMVHSLPPCTKDDEAFFKWTKVPTNHAIRAKLIILANRILRKKCEELSVGFIDVWDDLAENGFLRQEYELDGMHVNEKAVLISLEKIADNIFDRTEGNHSILQYQFAAGRAQDFIPDPNYGQSNWAETGWTVGLFDNHLITSIQNSLNYDKPSDNTFAHPDWVGSSRAERAGIIFAEPNSSTLEETLDVFSTPFAQVMLHAGVSKSLTIISFRPIKIIGNASGSNLLAPPHSRRAVLILEHTGSIFLDALNSQNSQEIIVTPGALIVFDPVRWSCRYVPEFDSMCLAEISLIPRLSNHPFRVLWTGGNDWPADPFCYSLTGSIASPPFFTEKVHERALPIDFDVNGA